MKNNETMNLTDERRSERGAALITMLLISSLLLVAGGALILTTGATNTNAIDATAETQAYYAAEAGLQDALSVLRGNVPARGGLALPAGTKIRSNFRTANVLSTSNLANDVASNPDGNSATNDGFARLSGWLPYNNATLNARVPVPGTLPGQAMSYALSITDPEDPNRTQLAADANYQPGRLLIQVQGFGPRGAQKFMEMMVNRQQFDFTPRSTLLTRGAEDGSPMNGFSIGNSNAKEYNGNDAASPAQPPLPVFGTTSNGNAVDVAATVLSSKPNTVTAAGSAVAQVPNSDLAPWLRSADAARAMLMEMAAVAQSSGRYFTSTPGNFGSAGNPAFTFVDGDCSLSSGEGLLIVTGTLTMSGNASFDGLILVLGEGNMQRNGGGNGDILGAIVVAKFARTWPASENAQPHPFLAPTFDTNGGGNSTVRYHSTNVNNAMNVLGSRVTGVREL